MFQNLRGLKIDYFANTVDLIAVTVYASLFIYRYSLKLKPMPTGPVKIQNYKNQNQNKVNQAKFDTSDI